jgi:hypothetical protein
MSMAAMSRIAKESETMLLTKVCSSAVGLSCAVRNKITHEFPISRENQSTGSGIEIRSLGVISPAWNVFIDIVSFTDSLRRTP